MAEGTSDGSLRLPCSTFRMGITLGRRHGTKIAFTNRPLVYRGGHICVHLLLGVALVGIGGAILPQRPSAQAAVHLSQRQPLAPCTGPTF